MNYSSQNRFQALFSKFSSLNDSIIGGQIPEFNHLQTLANFNGEIAKVPGDTIQNSDITLKFKLEENYENYITLYDWMINNFTYANDFSRMQFDNIDYIILNSKYKPIFSFNYGYVYPTVISSINHETTTTDAEEIVFDVTFVINIVNRKDI